jgi:hypothetical protein
LVDVGKFGKLAIIGLDYYKAIWCHFAHPVGWVEVRNPTLTF